MEMPVIDPEPIVYEPELIHEHFGLSYASYLVVPRSVLQSMPAEWQQKFVALLKEMGAAFGHVMDQVEYRVQSLNESGLFTEDPLRDYERGRRRLEARPKE